MLRDVGFGFKRFYFCKGENILRDVVIYFGKWQIHSMGRRKCTLVAIVENRERLKSVPENFQVIQDRFLANFAV